MQPNLFNLLTQTPTPGSLDIQGIRLEARLCTRGRHRLSACTRCADACPVQAIQLDGSPRADPQRCTGCGLCAAVCPTGAFEPTSPSDAGLLHRIERLADLTDTIALVCPRYVQASAGVEGAAIGVPCLGRLDAAVLVGAAALGLRAIYLLDRACAGCGCAAGRELAARAAEQANALLQAFPAAGTLVSVRPDLPAGVKKPEPPAGPPVSRRRLFRLMSQPEVAAQRTFAEPGGPPEGSGATAGKGLLPPYVPASRVLLLAALRRLRGEPAAASRAAGGLFADFGYDENCNGCQMCAFFCPTGALRQVNQDGRPGVVFRAALCTNCGLCRDICHKRAVTLQPAVELDRILADGETIHWMRKVEN